MGKEVFVRKGSLSPLNPCSTISRRRLNRKDPECWSFTMPFPAVGCSVILPLLLLSFFVVMAIVVREAWFLVPLAVFLLIVFALCWKNRSYLLTPRFDFGSKCFYRSLKKPRSGEFEDQTDYHPFADFGELQLVGKMVRQSKGGPVPWYELNLCLRDGSRFPVCESGDFKTLEADAKELARALDLHVVLDVSGVIPPKPLPMWAAVILPLIMLLGGLVPLVFGVLVPLQKNARTAHWQEVPAQVVSSRLLSAKRRSRNSHYTVYKAEVTYTYKFKGKVYSSDRHDMFSDGYSSNYGRQSRSVRENPPGRQRSCFVDPAAPAEAVLSREIPRKELAFEGVLFGLLSLSGGVFFCYLLHLRRRRME